MLRSLAARSLSKAKVLHPASASITFAPQGTRAMHGYVRSYFYRMYQRKKEQVFKRIGPARVTPRSEYTDWNYNAEIYSFAKRLSEKFDEKLLRTVFVDKSFVHQQQQQQAELNLEGHMEEITDNTSLASAGSSLLNSLVQDILRQEYPKLPSEGISAITTYLTSQEALSNIANLLGTKDLILCEEYPPSPSTSANVFNALIGALDKSSGTQRTRRFICDLVVTQICGRDLFDLWEITHPWSYLCNMLESQNKEKPEPRLIAQSGVHTVLAAYIVGLYDTDKALLGKGFGETVEIAHEMAARDVLRDIFGIRRPKNDYKFLAQPEREETLRVEALN